MKKLASARILFVTSMSLVFGSPSLVASTDILLQAESIKNISQDLAKNYFYIEQGIQASSAKDGIKKDILALDDSIQKLQISTKDAQTKQIIEFMFFTVDELKSILKGKFNAENGGLVLDYTETLLEGSESIIGKNKGKEESMLDVVEEMNFLIDRASKYYIAFRAGYTDEINIQQVNLAVEKFDTLLKKVQTYPYPGPIANGPVKKLAKYWPVSQNFYLGVKKSDLPTIVFISTKHMKTALEELIAHHKAK